MCHLWRSTEINKTQSCLLMAEAPQYFNTCSVPTSQWLQKTEVWLSLHVPGSQKARLPTPSVLYSCQILFLFFLIQEFIIPLFDILILPSLFHSNSGNKWIDNCNEEEEKYIVKRVFLYSWQWGLSLTTCCAVNMDFRWKVSDYYHRIQHLSRKDTLSSFKLGGIMWCSSIFHLHNSKGGLGKMYALRDCRGQISVE